MLFFKLINGKDYAHLKNADITAWLEYFTDGLLSSLHVLNAEIRMLNLSLSTGKDNVGLSCENEDILSYVAKFGSINISEAEDILPEMNRRSIKRGLKQLVDDGYLEVIGAIHDAKYILRSIQKSDHFLIAGIDLPDRYRATMSSSL